MNATEARLNRRDELAAMRSAIADRYWANDPIEDLVAALAAGMDKILQALFAEHFADHANVALYAVGGYGRAELHPGSDIDLLLVAKRPSALKRQIELFWQGVFDLNLEVGYSVRDLKACKQQCRDDITVATAMLERRLLCGDKTLNEKLDKAMGSSRLWPAAKFFAAKLHEQQARHRQFNDVEYDLEPNIKSSPGGLRDIHTVLWICQRSLGTRDLDQLEQLGVLTKTEATWLRDGRRFLWWVRFGLHLVAGRKEDHLQFDYQRELSQRLGFVDTDAKQGVERFMHHYYRHVLALTEVNDILLQHFRESMIPARKLRTEPLNERFQLVDHYIEVTHEQVFADTPSALMEMFVVMAHRKDIAGVRASTIRLIRDHLHLIDDEFRCHPTHTKLFIDLLKAPYTIVSTLTRMRRYGVLGRYIPEFGEVIGQMQHDMFHVYTVDAHTMMVIRNMRRFRYRASEEQFPIAYHCVHTIPKVELLYIAGLYHDIGKGRGGDHSTLGAQDARGFCERHGLNQADTDLVCWLVQYHLYMSSVAQRQDIYDPDVVHAFAQKMGSEMRLDYLYALTVADINATNPTLWNSWRATLMHQLYNESRKYLRADLQTPAGKAESVAAYQERALERLAESDFSTEQIQALWCEMGDDYFLRHTTTQIAALTEAILGHKNEDGPFVHIENKPKQLPGEGATQIYVYAQDKPQLFAATVVALSEVGLSVVDATISTATSGYCFDTYTVLNADGSTSTTSEKAAAQLVQRLRSAIDQAEQLALTSNRRLPRQLRQLSRPTEVTIQPTIDGTASQLTIVASDRPGILATIGLMFVDLKLQLLSAKIATLGERVEDNFVILGADGAPIPPGEAAYTLEQTIRQRLDRALANTR